MTRFTPQWLQAGNYAAAVDRRLIGALWPAARSTGCGVSQSSGMVVGVAAGQVAVPTSNSTGSVLCSSDATELVTVTAAPPSGTNRIDLIVCQARGADVDGGANNDFIFSAVAGAPAATPVAPAVPANAVALAQIYVAGGSAAITNANITDVRPGTLTVGPSFTPVHFRAAHGAQSIPRVVWTTITAWNTPNENVGGGSFVNGVYTVPATGRYLVLGGVLWAVPTTTGWLGLQSQIAGTPGLAAPFAQDLRGWANPTGSNLNTGPAQVVVPCNAGDTLFLQAYNSHPSAAVSTFGNYFGLEIHRVE